MYIFICTCYIYICTCFIFTYVCRRGGNGSGGTGLFLHMYVQVYIYARMCYIYIFMSGSRHQGQWRRKCKFTCVCFIITHVCVIHRCSGGVVLYLSNVCVVFTYACRGGGDNGSSGVGVYLCTYVLYLHMYLLVAVQVCMVAVAQFHIYKYIRCIYMLMSRRSRQW